MTSDGPGEAEPRAPGDLIKDEIKKRGWTQTDLAQILQMSLTRLNDVIKSKREITPEIAVSLAAALGTTPDELLQLEAAYRLHVQRGAASRLAGTEDETRVLARRRLFELAPIKELQKRGWIGKGDDPAKIEEELKCFFGISSLDKSPALPGSTRKSRPLDDLSASQRAWCFRVKQLAPTVVAEKFEAERFEGCKRELRRAAAYSREVRRVPEILAGHGIRFVVVEPLSAGKIDGIATWLDDGKNSPVIGMSLRYDRVDYFWHTLCHELAHIRNRDDTSVDIDGDLSDPTRFLEVKSQVERRADSEASATLVDQEELESFIRRVGPFYSKERVNQFANKIKIHPGIIVGQLQHRGEIGYASNRDTLVKIRAAIVGVALTDGWGLCIDPRILG